MKQKRFNKVGFFRGFEKQARKFYHASAAQNLKELLAENYQTSNQSQNRLVKIRIQDKNGKTLEHHFVRANKWGLPAGLVEKGESLEQGAARELLERTGYEIDPSSLALEGKDGPFHVFSATEGFSQKLKPGEAGKYSTKIRWV